MQPLKKLALTLETLADREHYLFASSDFEGAFAGYDQWPVLLSRAVKAGLLKRVCRGIYLYAKAGYPAGDLLFHAAARLRADEFNYISLETALSDAGLISQIPMNWISLMSSGRSHVVDCGEFGHIEFVHTEQMPEEIAGELTYDATRHLWRASEKQALRDMKRTRRSMDLVNIGKDAARTQITHTNPHRSLIPSWMRRFGRVANSLSCVPWWRRNCSITTSSAR